MRKLLAVVAALLFGILVWTTAACGKVVQTSAGELVVYDDITYQDGVVFRIITNEINRDVKIIITSGGGSVYGLQLMLDQIDSLKARGIKVTTEVYGVAYSAAAILFLMGDERIVHSDAELMFHEGGIYDNQGNDITESVVSQNPRVGFRLYQTNKIMYDLLNRVTGISINKLKELCKKRQGWWMFAKEAVIAGVATKMVQ